MSTRVVVRRRGRIGLATPPAPEGLRIGLMGGSFNPPHAGHLAVAEAALKRLRLDRLWWIVSPGNPLKSHAELASLESRLAACRVLARDRRIAVTGFERALDGPYTVETLEFLVGRYPRTRFVWIMGADSLATFHRWKRFEDIAALVPIAVVDRPGWRLRAMASPAARLLRRFIVSERHAGRLALCAAPAMTFLSMRLSPLSSTALRARHAGR